MRLLLHYAESGANKINADMRSLAYRWCSTNPFRLSDQKNICCGRRGRTSSLMGLWVLVLALLHTIDLRSVGVAGQFRNDQDPEHYRYRELEDAARGWRPYSTPPPSLGSYSSGDTYHGTNRRYGHYDQENKNRGFDNRYEYENRYGDLLRYGGGRYLTQGIYDSRGRLRPGYDDRNRQSDQDKLESQIGVLQMYRPDLQGELRPGKVPGTVLCHYPFCYYN